ncbi:hypothetical protein HN419_04410 [Candidatus Woesearchaeota archaeon]|jgi:Zn-dependent protease|nr:hypothetical protein [Candidatus Woesearchaeota archaeon]MBT3537879.1 hypothetical protein [Candidatus Woesearchaeota archaeon]MBT4698010.1 hypothetical protein [Candidatus Woesearchaeota archaeon]MBT4716599.1 hypothetical protein [Candidatus Woesearchaeota archaeon]MBT7105548.1 hypothetical protein [Candidatus Woesearchaeota archaeon]
MRYKTYWFAGINTSNIELIALLKSWAAISLAFSIALAGLKFSLGFIIIFLMAAITVGLGFLLHELAHKVVAQKYKCAAEFRSDDKMLILAIVLAFTGFIFAAPGAVLIHGHINKKQNGIISAAGLLQI